MACAGLVDSAADAPERADAPVDSGVDMDATAVVDVVAPDANADSNPDETGSDTGPDGAPTAADASEPIYSWPDAGSPTVRAIVLPTADLVLDPVRRVLYVTVQATAPAMGNTVATIDPSTASVTGALFVGSDPGALAISDDAKTLYVGIDGAASVRLVDLASGTAGPLVPLPTPAQGLIRAGFIRAVPGSSSQYLVSARQSDCYPGYWSQALFDGATLVGTDESACDVDITFLDAVTFYRWVSLNSTSGNLSLTTIEAGAFQLDASWTEPTNLGGIVYQGGWLFGANGTVIDAPSLALIGSYTFPDFDSIWPDGNGHEVWTLNQYDAFWPTPATLYDFDRTSFTLRGKAALPQVDTNLTNSLVRWAANGFAFRTSAAVYVVTLP